MDKIKVLHYTPGFLSGGIESRLLDWYRNIDRSNIQFCLVKLNNIDDTHNISEFKRLGGEVYNFPSLNLKNSFKYIKELTKLFKNNKFDVVHVHDVNSGIFVLIIAKISKIKLRILHSRTTDYLPNEKNLLIKKSLKKLGPIFSNKFFACSDEAGIWLFGDKKSKDVKVIKNGIQIEKFIFDEEKRNSIRQELGIKDKKVVGTISRLSPQKNINFLLKVFSKIYEKDNNTVLLIVGEGQMKQELIEKAKYLSLENQIIFLGEKNDVWNYYMAFDLFISTSLYEGFGTTAIESQATGTPTLLSTGFPNVVCVTNIVERINLDDSIEKWAERSIKLMKVRGKKTITNEIIEAGYSAEQVAKNLECIYLNIK
ncbi:glycosyltransferase [Romboutsia sp.]|uniref:glycosyltransferase n=1 Tax=Romboutsia sp. TaxID=1965302 RepID=UPI003F2A6C5F